ncbi:MAG: sporulation protein [Firmicutes bacterium]|nr:sporulation protein [Bacillota bacterium]
MSDFGNNVDSLFSKIENFVSTKTVIGEPMVVGSVTLVPLVEISFGMGASADNSKAAKGVKDASVAGVGAKVKPSSILVINDGNVQMISTSDKSSLNKLIDMVPGIVDKASAFFADSNTEEEEDSEDK